VRRGILHSSSGPDGGYSLKKKPRDISLRDVYEAIEGDMHLVDCMDKDGACELFDTCTQRSVWDHLQVNTLKFLSKVNLRDIADSNFKNLNTN
jgi:Rrf2 family protein